MASYSNFVAVSHLFLLSFIIKSVVTSEITPTEFEAAFQGECRTNGPCQHLCFDLHDGTFECACRDGYTLADNGYSCIENRLLEEEAEEEEARQNHIGGYSLMSSSNDGSSTDKKKWSVMSSSANSRNAQQQQRLTPSNKRQKKTKGASKKHITQGWLRMKAFQHQHRADESSSKPSNIDDDAGSNGGNAGGAKSQVDTGGGENGSNSNSQISSGINEQFSSCREIECEAGGTCIEEDELPSSSQRTNIINNNVNSIGRRKGGNKSVGGLVTTIDVGGGGNRKKRIRCRCPLGRRGFFCEKPSEVRFPRFRGNSYLALPTLKGVHKSMQATIEFRPEHHEGLLLYSGEKQNLKGDFIALLLNQGFVEFRFDCGMGEGVVRSERPVVLKSWNTVTIYRDGWNAWLQLNTAPQSLGQSEGLFSRITFKLELFLGGSPNLTLIEDRTNAFTGLTGCVRKLEINGRSYDFRSDNRGDAIDGIDIEECGADVCSRTSCLNGGQCVAASPEKGICLCPLGFGGIHCELESDFTVPSFNGSSYLQFPGFGDSLNLYFEIQIIFKPRSANGLLLYNGHRMDGGGDFLSINLIDGYVEFRFNPGNGPAVIRSLRPVEMDDR